MVFIALHFLSVIFSLELATFLNSYEHLEIKLLEVIAIIY